MQLPILGRIPTLIPIDFAANSSSLLKDASESSDAVRTKGAPQHGANDVVYNPAPMSTETRASLLALQEEPSQKSSTETVNINGLSIIVSGHSIDAREGVSLLRSASVAETRAMMADIASMQGAENSSDAGSRQEVQSDRKIIRLDLQGGMMEVESKALGPLPGGATGTYMNEDFFHTRGRWTNGNPMEMSNSEASIKSQQRKRLEALMNSVDAERKLKAEYGQDIKLVYSHTDNSFIMLTPDDAKYDTLQSAESGVQTVIDEVHRGFVDKSMASEILKQYGYKL